MGSVRSEADWVEFGEYVPETGQLFYKGRELQICKLCSGYLASAAYRVDGKNRQATHIIWWLQTGEWPPPGMFVDHADGDPTNNRWKNLRLATPRQNAQNADFSSKRWSGDKAGLEQCVAKKSGRYEVKVDGVYYGLFKTIPEANARARELRRAVSGEFDISNRGKKSAEELVELYFASGDEFYLEGLEPKVAAEAKQHLVWLREAEKFRMQPPLIRRR